MFDEMCDERETWISWVMQTDRITTVELNKIKKRGILNKQGKIVADMKAMKYIWKAYTEELYDSSKKQDHLQTSDGEEYDEYKKGSVILKGSLRMQQHD